MTGFENFTLLWTMDRNKRNQTKITLLCCKDRNRDI